MERNVRLGCVVAGALWVMAVALTLFGSIAAIEENLSLSLVLLSHAVLGMGAAATLTVRNLFERQTRLVTSAYQLGRDERPVTSISR